MDLNVKLQAFEGPLDLLLHLLDKNKVDIYDIPIAEITNQYMEYMDAMQKQDLDITSEFLVMAATLLSIKSRMLLPQKPAEEGEEEDDPRAELVRQLLEYKMYKYMAEQLKDRQDQADQVIFRGASLPKEVAAYEVPVDPNELIAQSDLTLQKLNDIFRDVMKRKDQRMDPIRAKFGNIKKEEISLEARMESVRDFAKRTRHFTFRSLLESAKTKTDVVVTFLAILEMMKFGQITIRQEETFGEIEIESNIMIEE